jgi:hypothetical protein
MRKVNLCTIIASFKPKNRLFKLGVLLEAHGHIVVRKPMYAMAYTLGKSKETGTLIWILQALCSFLNTFGETWDIAKILQLTLDTRTRLCVT